MSILKSLAVAAFALCTMCASAQNEKDTIQGDHSVIHGDADSIVPYTYGQRFHYLNANSKFILMDGADHSFSGHEKQVAHDVAQFLATRFRR